MKTYCYLDHLVDGKGNKGTCYLSMRPDVIKVLVGGGREGGHASRCRCGIRCVIRSRRNITKGCRGSGCGQWYVCGGGVVVHVFCGSHSCIHEIHGVESTEVHPPHTIPRRNGIRYPNTRGWKFMSFVIIPDQNCHQYPLRRITLRRNTRVKLHHVDSNKGNNEYNYLTHFYGRHKRVNY